jgi:hypothetical protein
MLPWIDLQWSIRLSGLRISGPRRIGSIVLSNSQTRTDEHSTAIAEKYSVDQAVSTPRFGFGGIQLTGAPRDELPANVSMTSYSHFP